MEQEYVKLIDGKIEFAPRNKDSVINYNLDVDLMIADGYKLFIRAIVPPSIRMYHFEYVEHENDITEIVVYDETQEEADERILEQAKEAKILENDRARDSALLEGVVYRDVLFDSDTDQKVNLLATISMMQEEQTIVWYGMDNQPLECDREDLINIGGLITQLHSFCWNKNAEIKQEINEATTVQEVEEVEINYESEE